LWGTVKWKAATWRRYVSDFSRDGMGISRSSANCRSLWNLLEFQVYHKTLYVGSWHSECFSQTLRSKPEPSL
jgi:hypothetical protein